MKLRIKEIIKEKNMTINSLAEKMGINRVNLSSSINGNPTFETLQKIASALNVAVSSLIEVESELYGIVQFKGKTYKIDSEQALQTLYKDYLGVKNILPLE